ncbi:hypothetical protein C8R44DRAFT_869646 [Mycena epipterygia]|nr:hypothetical protein C8R44DRAFT_869646 [Mycena epipterygia]
MPPKRKRKVDDDGVSAEEPKRRSQAAQASARYYAKHPEIREKKRLQMAQSRAAKKARKRQWDPPKKAKAVVPMENADAGSEDYAPPLPDEVTEARPNGTTQTLPPKPMTPMSEYEQRSAAENNDASEFEADAGEMSADSEEYSPRASAEERKKRHCQASARYYANHPEIREKARLRMAQSRGAKKAQRRQPSRKAKPVVPLEDTDANEPDMDSLVPLQEEFGLDVTPQNLALHPATPPPEHEQSTAEDDDASEFEADAGQMSADSEEYSPRVGTEEKKKRHRQASARYYANHPEIREKARLRMAQSRAAKKARRRQWDPPKKPKPKPAVWPEDADAGERFDADPVVPLQDEADSEEAGLEVAAQTVPLKATGEHSVPALAAQLSTVRGFELRTVFSWGVDERCSEALVSPPLS